jgi:hypothetical protein
MQYIGKIKAVRLPILICCGFMSAAAHSVESFRFEAFPELAEMRGYIEKEFALGASRETLRTAFIEQGKATLKINPNQIGTEKYLYDINLCGYYVWRWNVSADFDAQGKLLQAYVNAEPIFKDGTPKKDPKDVHSRTGKSVILKIQKSRPQASKGESVITALVLDKDSDTRTTDDQFVQVGGPTRADPLDMGNLHVYDGELWRSIVDADDAGTIVPYVGDCSAVDVRVEQLKQQQKANSARPAH